MPFPDYIPTRQVTVGAAAVLESGETLLTKMSVASTNSLVWDATGYRFESRAVVNTSLQGTEAALDLPCTDTPGWRDGRTSALIDVAEPDSYTHRYVAKVSFSDAAGRPVGSELTIGPFVLPEGDGPIDLDKVIPLSTVPGGQVSIPDRWTQLTADALAAAERAEAALSESSERVDQIAAEAVVDETTLLGGAVAHVAMPTANLTGLVPNQQSAAELNTAIIQAALSSGKYRQVHIPAGLFYITKLTVPANVHLTGEYSRAYTTLPTTGTRLRSMDTTPQAIVTMAGRSMLTKICIAGPGSASTGPAVEIASNCPVIKDVAIGYAAVGIEGAYHAAIIDNAHVYNNTSDGVRNFVDGKVMNCTINANGGRGIVQLTGANATQFINNRVEWNNGAGISFYGASTNAIVSGIVDRNGAAGISLINTLNTIVDGVNLWRNGAKSEGVPNGDCNLYLESNTRLVVGTITTRVGGDDSGGGGYNSPLTAVRAQSNIDCLVVGCDLQGGTSRSWTQAAGSPETRGIRHSNLLLTGESQPFYGMAHVGEGSLGSIPAAGSGSVKFGLPAQAANAPGRILQVALTSRTASPAPFAATVPVVISRAGAGAATVAVTPPANLVGAVYGTDLVVTAAVNADGTELTVTVTNNGATTHNVMARLS